MEDDDAKTLTQLHADDIRWQLTPIARIEETNLLDLTESETWQYVRDLQAEIRGLRLTLSVALDHIAKLTNKLKRATRIIAAQRDQIRELVRQRRAA